MPRSASRPLIAAHWVLFCSPLRCRFHKLVSTDIDLRGELKIPHPPWAGQPTVEAAAAAKRLALTAAAEAVEAAGGSAASARALGRLAAAEIALGDGHTSEALQVRALCPPMVSLHRMRA